MNIQREFPDHCVTRFPMRVRFGETDLMGIMHHGSYVAYLEAARIEYLRRRAFNYLEMTQRGFHMPVIEMQLRYKKAARFDDEILVETRLIGLSRVTVNFGYRLLRQAVDGSEEVLAEAHTLLACIDDAHKPVALPGDVREVLFLPEVGEAHSERKPSVAGIVPRV
jgi:acyl-CoA thioester hydrolase